MEKESCVQVQVTVELGHTACCRKKPTLEGFTHDWKVFVRGPANYDVSHFVEKVQFQLHESFTKPKRVVKDPPYHVEQSGYGGFVLPVDIYFKNKEDPKKVHFDYDLFLPAVGLAPINNIRSEALTFTNPTEEFKRKLLKGGGTIIHMGLNGFHSTPVPGNTAGEVGGKRPGGVVEEQAASSTVETEKSKKPRIEKSNGSKTVPRKQEQGLAAEKMVTSLGNTAEKLPASLGNTAPTAVVKKKKKKGEEGGGVKAKPVGFIPLEVPSPGSELKEKLEEVGDIKLKIKSLTPKGNNERKKEAKTPLETKASNGKKRKSSPNEVRSKKKVKETKVAVKQTKEDKKTDKVKIRRGSDDSSTSSSSSLIIGNIGSKSTKNVALGALLKELEVESEGEDDDDHLDILTPFQSNSTSEKAKGYVNGIKSTANSLPCKKSSKGVTKSNGHLKDDEMCSAYTNGKRNGGDGLNDLAKHDVSRTSPLKRSPMRKVKEGKPSNREESSATELLHLHKRLMATRDTTCLQRIVDILEASGAYSISEDTFNFDLCALDKLTIKKLESCLEW